MFRRGRKREDPALGTLSAGELLTDDDTPPGSSEPGRPPSSQPPTWPSPTPSPERPKGEGPPPAPSPTPPATAWWSPSRPPLPRPRRQRWFVGRAIVVLVLMALGGVGYLADLIAGKDSSPRQTSTTERPREGDGHGGGVRESPSPVSPRGMKRAIAELRDRLGPAAKLQSLRVDPQSTQAIARGKLVVLRRGEDPVVLPGPSTILDGFTLEAVDPRAPARIQAALRRRERDLNYAVLTGDAIRGGVQWIAFVDEGRTGYRADRSGRGLCPLGRRC